MKKRDFKYVSGKKYDGMMGRCYRETDASYDNYGGSGIKVCSEWIEDIEKFRNWLKGELKRMNINEDEFIKNSRSKYILDRIDPEDHYTPRNCRLVNVQKSSRNKIKIKGKIITSAEGKKYEF